MLLTPAVKAMSTVGLLTHNFHTSFSIIILILYPEYYYNSRCFVLLEPRPCLILSSPRVNSAISLLVFPAFSCSAPPDRKCSGFFPTGASILETTICEYISLANRFSTSFILVGSSYLLKNISRCS